MHATANQCCSRHVIVRPVALTGAARAQQDNFTYLPLSLPEPINSRVTKSQFLKSSKAVSECPRNRHPEFAVIGRSNVGKSSLINTLTGNDKLAKVSKEPGAHFWMLTADHSPLASNGHASHGLRQVTLLPRRHQAHQPLLIDDGWCLVDLPGYGFSKTAGKAAREEWLSFTKDFFISRDALVHVLLLADASLPPQAVDIDCANWLAECQVPFCIVFTKVDNRKKDLPTPAANIKAFKTMLAADWEALPWCFETSSRTGTGKAQLLGYLASLRQLHRQHQGQ